MRFNSFHWGCIHSLSWGIVLTDGWITHTHYLAFAGFVLMFYSLWKMILVATSEEDKDA
jgi:hypothetical protein